MAERPRLERAPEAKRELEFEEDVYETEERASPTLRPADRRRARKARLAELNEESERLEAALTRLETPELEKAREELRLAEKALRVRKKLEREIVKNEQKVLVLKRRIEEMGFLKRTILSIAEMFGSPLMVPVGEICDEFPQFCLKLANYQIKDLKVQLGDNNASEETVEKKRRTLAVCEEKISIKENYRQVPYRAIRERLKELETDIDKIHSELYPDQG